MSGTAFGRHRARNAKPKTKYVVEGTLEMPRVAFSESTEAYSEEQAKRFIMRRLAKIYGYVRVFSRDVAVKEAVKSDT